MKTIRVKGALYRLVDGDLEWVANIARPGQAPKSTHADPIAEEARLRIHVLDKILSAHALERIRRTA